MGDAKKDDLRVRFDSRLKLKFCGSQVTTDAGMMAYAERLQYRHKRDFVMPWVNSWDQNTG